MLHSYPQAILHIDGDAFFTSVEQALEPSLRGRPVVTGKERGIIACASYEAKRLGVRRGLPLFEARKLIPGLVILPNDYETYSLYSKRMFDIIRRFTPIVEEYSIDEAFADITGLRRLYRCSYEDIAARIQDTVRRELGLTVSIGLSLTKSLAKLCSDFRKPNGLTAVPGKFIHVLLRHVALEDVWGFGPNTVKLLQTQGVHSVYDYAARPEPWAARLLGKPGREIWNELRGNPMWKVTTEEKSSYATILKSKTFSPASGDPEFVYAKLMRNVESAFMKARRYKLRPRAIGIVLRHQDFRHDGLEARLSRPTASTLEVVPFIRRLFDQTFRPGSQYRSTMVILGFMESDATEQTELFENRLKIDSLRRITNAVDIINNRFGKHTVHTATGLLLPKKPSSPRDEEPARRALQLRGERGRRRLALPRMDLRV